MSDERVMKQGVSDGHGKGYWGATPGRLLAYFPAQKRKRYRLDLDVLDDGSRLSPYHPRLKVTVDLFVLDGYAIGEGVTEIAGLLITAIGILPVAVTIIAKAIGRHRSSQSHTQINLFFSL